MPEEPLLEFERLKYIREAEQLYKNSLINLPTPHYVWSSVNDSTALKEDTKKILKVILNSKHRNSLIEHARDYHCKEFMKTKLNRFKRRDIMINDPITATISLKNKALIVRSFYQGKSPATIYKELGTLVPIDLIKRIIFVNTRGWRSWKHDITQAYMNRCTAD